MCASVPKVVVPLGTGSSKTFVLLNYGVFSFNVGG